MFKLEDEGEVALAETVAELGPRICVLEDEEATPELASGTGAVDTIGSPVLAANALVEVEGNGDSMGLEGSPALGVNTSVAEGPVERAAEAEEGGPHWPVAVTVMVTMPSTPVVVTASPAGGVTDVKTVLVPAAPKTAEEVSDDENEDEAEVVGMAFVGVGKGVDLPELAPKMSEDRIPANPVVVANSVEEGAAMPVEENMLSRFLQLRLMAATRAAVGEDFAELRLMGDWEDWEAAALTAEVVRGSVVEAETASVGVAVIVTKTVVANCWSPSVAVAEGVAEALV